MESVFLGVWIFGRGRVSARVHLASIWLASIGTLLSAVFILAANSWMQHPVGFAIDKATGQAVMTNFWAVITNATFFGAYFHVVFAALLTGSVFMLAIAAWHIRRGQQKDAFIKVAKVAIVVTLLAALGTCFMGDTQARQMDTQQPMKMAAAEAMYNTANGASFSLLTIGDLTGNPLFQIRVPHLLSIIADNSLNGQVKGVKQLQAADVKKYGPGNYIPVLWVTYWTFRLMVGLGLLMIALGALGLWLMRKKRLDRSSWFLRFASLMLLAPFLANSFGWIFTEEGRQPWVVYGLLKTSQAVSHISVGYLATSLIGYTAIYSFLAFIEIGLMIKVARKAPEELSEHDDEKPLELVY
jgi:cytochrome d ubiquinol oxidase subunit I